jgi:hypothetical protein
VAVVNVDALGESLRISCWQDCRRAILRRKRMAQAEDVAVHDQDRRASPGFWSAVGLDVVVLG